MATSMSRAPHHRFELEDYLFLEHGSDVRHEFQEGAVYAMAGGSARHAELAARAMAALITQLGGRGCRVFSSDLRVRCEATGLVTYPDLSVVCGELALEPRDRWGETSLNPTVVVEVLSPSTEAYDRGDKLASYQQIPSLREVVLVAQDAPRVDVWRRGGEGGWDVETAVDGTIELRSIGCALALPSLYA